MSTPVYPLGSTRYAGYFVSADLLPLGLEEPSWALVGKLSEASPYAYYTAAYVPTGYDVGWNDLSEAIGQYDLTANVISLYDRFLLTEYNVSNNHTQDAYVYSPAWQRIPYQVGFAEYTEEKVYRMGNLCNVSGFVVYSFRCVCDTADKPVRLLRGTNRFSIDTALIACPEEFRRLGMKLTFISVYTSQCETWMFVGDSLAQWSDLSYWVQLQLRAQENELVSRPLDEDAFNLPQLVADRAVSDELGRNIASTYLTRDGAEELIKSLLEENSEENEN